MSMNLNATTKNGVINLWQTPTQITYTILPASIGEVKGKKATDALMRYMEWVKYSTDGVWNNVEELQDAKQRVDEHLEYVRKFINDKSLRVWVM
jgi:hypothetical protein